MMRANVMHICKVFIISIMLELGWYREQVVPFGVTCSFVLIYVSSSCGTEINSHN